MGPAVNRVPTLPDRGLLSDMALNDLLLAAVPERFSGRIEIRSEVRASIHLSRGFVVSIQTASASLPGATADKREAQRALAAQLAVLLDVVEGEFDCVRSTEPPSAPRWMFGPRALLDAATAHRPRHTDAAMRRHAAASPNASRQIALSADRPPSNLTERAWTVIVAMAEPASVSTLAERLGWPSSAIIEALGDVPIEPPPAEAGHLAVVTAPARPVSDAPARGEVKASNEAEYDKPGERRATDATAMPAASTPGRDTARPHAVDPTTDDDKSGGRSTSLGASDGQANRAGAAPDAGDERTSPMRASALRKLIQSLR